MGKINNVLTAFEKNEVPPPKPVQVQSARRFRGIHKEGKGFLIAYFKLQYENGMATPWWKIFT